MNVVEFCKRFRFKIYAQGVSVQKKGPVLEICVLRTREDGRPASLPREKSEGLGKKLSEAMTKLGYTNKVEEIQNIPGESCNFRVKILLTMGENIPVSTVKRIVDAKRGSRKAQKEYEKSQRLSSQL